MKNSSNSVDRGWAWVVLTACTLEAFFLLGYIKSFGLYFVEFLERYEADAASLSLVLTIQTLVASLTALIVLNIGPLCTTNRTFMLCGSILIAAATMLNGFSPHVGVLTFSHGVVFGIGMGCTHAPAMVMVSLYFDKRRGLANCVTNLGASVGGFVLPLFIRYLLDFYGLQGSLIIMSGILLNIVVFSTVMRPLEFKDKDVYCKGSTLRINNSDVLKNNSKNTDENSIKRNNLNFERNLFKPGLNVQSDVHTNLKENENGHGNLIQEFDFKFTTKETITHNPQNAFKKQKLFHSHQQLGPKKSNRKRTISTNSERSSALQIEEKLPYSNILKQVSTSSTILYAHVNHTPEKDSVKDYEDENTDCKQNKGCLKCSNFSCKEIFKTLISVHLIVNRLFILLLIVSVLSIIGCALPVTFIPPHAKDLGIQDKDIALLLSIVGGSDLLGRILTIFIADRKFLKCHRVVAVSLFITGIALNLAPILTDFWSIAILCVTYGIFAGVYLTLFPVIIVDFVGVENLSSGLGLTAISHGCALAIAMPIIGLLRDFTGSYLGPLHMMGTCLLVGAGILIMEPVVRKCEERRAKIKQLKKLYDGT